MRTLSGSHEHWVLLGAIFFLCVLPITEYRRLANFTEFNVLENVKTNDHTLLRLRNDAIKVSKVLDAMLIWNVMIFIIIKPTYCTYKLFHEKMRSRSLKNYLAAEKVSQI